MSVDEHVEDGVSEDFEESAYEVARRLYGRRLEPRNRRELERSLVAWRELGSADRTFVLAHLGMLRLRAVEEQSLAIPAAVAPSHPPVEDDDVTEEIVLSVRGTSAS